MRTIEISLKDDEEVIKLYATRGRCFWLALIAGPDGYRYLKEEGGGTYGNLVPYAAIVADINKRVEAYAGACLHLKPIETSCAVCS